MEVSWEDWLPAVLPLPFDREAIDAVGSVGLPPLLMELVGAARAEPRIAVAAPAWSRLTSELDEDQVELGPHRRGGAAGAPDVARPRLARGRRGRGARAAGLVRRRGGAADARSPRGARRGSGRRGQRASGRAGGRRRDGVTAPARGAPGLRRERRRGPRHDGALHRRSTLRLRRRARAPRRSAARARDRRRGPRPARLRLDLHARPRGRRRAARILACGGGRRGAAPARPPAEADAGAAVTAVPGRPARAPRGERRVRPFGDRAVRALRGRRGGPGRAARGPVPRARCAGGGAGFPGEAGPRRGRVAARAGARSVAGRGHRRTPRRRAAPHDGPHARGPGAGDARPKFPSAPCSSWPAWAPRR